MLDRGGNTDKVLFDNSHSHNFHTIWDSTMLEKHIKLDFEKSVQIYSDHLIQSLRNGMYSDMKNEWVSDFNLESRTLLGSIQKVVDWTVEENAYGCSVVWNRFDQDPTQNFGEDYYDDSIQFIDFQIAKGFIIFL